MGDELEKGKEKVEKMEVEEMTGKEKVVMVIEKKDDLYEYIRENVTEKDELEYYLNFMKTTYTFTKTKQKVDNDFIKDLELKKCNDAKIVALFTLLKKLYTSSLSGTDELSVIIQKEKGSVNYKVNSTVKSILKDFPNAAYIFSKQDEYTESRYKDNDTLKAGTYYIAYLSPPTEELPYSFTSLSSISIGYKGKSKDFSKTISEGAFQNRENEVLYVIEIWLYNLRSIRNERNEKLNTLITLCFFQMFGSGKTTMTKYFLYKFKQIQTEDRFNDIYRQFIEKTSTLYKEKGENDTNLNNDINFITSSAIIYIDLSAYESFILMCIDRGLKKG